MGTHSSFGLVRYNLESLLGTLKIVDRRIKKITNTIDHIIEADFTLC